MGSLVMDDKDSRIPLDPTRDSHIFCEDAADYEEFAERKLLRYHSFGLYKVDPSQPVEDWTDLPTMENPVCLFVKKGDPK